MRCQVVLEVRRGQQVGFDDIVEAKLSNGDQHRPRGRPLCAVKKLQRPFFFCHAKYAINSMLVTKIRVFWDLVRVEGEIYSAFSLFKSESLR